MTVNRLTWQRKSGRKKHKLIAIQWFIPWLQSVVGLISFWLGECSGSTQMILRRKHSVICCHFNIATTYGFVGWKSSLCKKKPLSFKKRRTFLFIFTQSLFYSIEKDAHGMRKETSSHLFASLLHSLYDGTMFESDDFIISFFIICFLFSAHSTV